MYSHPQWYKATVQQPSNVVSMYVLRFTKEIVWKLILNIFFSNLSPEKLGIAFRTKKVFSFNLFCFLLIFAGNSFC